MKHERKTIEQKAIEIDKFLTEHNIKRIAKNDISAKFNITHDDRGIMWSMLSKFGWRVHWSFLEKAQVESNPSES